MTPGHEYASRSDDVFCCMLCHMFSGITRLKVIECSADAFTQSLDAHMISKYEGNFKTKNHDQTPTAAMYGDC